MQTTRVDFAGSAATLKANLIKVVHLADSDQVALIFDKTNFHPIDFQWQDQPADQGWIDVKGLRFNVVNCCLAAVTDNAPQIYWHEEIPVKRGADQWQFLVAHIVEDNTKFFLNQQDQPLDVVLSVDQLHRRAISVAHSMCHLMALALNKISKSYWHSSPDRLDSLGNPDLDSLAIVNSKLSPLESVDCYRFGKSLRKKGFNAAKFLQDKDQVADQIQQQLIAWMSEPLKIRLQTFPSLITDRRFWYCKLPEGEAVIPCGGTHVEDFSMVKQVNIAYFIHADNELTITTRVA